jgi:hypothetical protein
LSIRRPSADKVNRSPEKVVHLFWPDHPSRTRGPADSAAVRDGDGQVATTKSIRANPGLPTGPGLACPHIVSARARPAGGFGRQERVKVRGRGVKTASRTAARAGVGD